MFNKKAPSMPVVVEVDEDDHYTIYTYPDSSALWNRTLKWYFEKFLKNWDEQGLKPLPGRYHFTAIIRSMGRVELRMDPIESEEGDQA